MTDFTIVGSERIFTGDIFNVRRDRVRMPTGTVAPREVVETGEAVAIVAVDGQKRVCLVRHYRSAFDGFISELPAGRMDVPNENPLETAKRELEEEAQLESESWTRLTTMITSPGFATERIHLYLAEGVSAASASMKTETADEESRLVIEMRPLREAVLDVQSGQIQDAKTIIGLLLASRYLSD